MKWFNCIVAVCVVLGVSNGDANAALNINWNASADISMLYNDAGSALTTDGLLIQVIVDVNGDTDPGAMISSRTLLVGSETKSGWTGPDSTTDDDQVLATLGSWSYQGPAGNYVAFPKTSDATPYASKKFYFRWFDNTTFGGATEAGIIYDTVGTSWVTPASDIAPSTLAAFTYGTKAAYVGGSQNGSSGWDTIAPVPEPGTMALLGLGLLTVGIRRRMKK